MTAADPQAPRVCGLDAALGGVRGTMAMVDRYRTSAGTNTEGGDLGHHAGLDLLIRHTVNYALAADVASRIATPGPLLDVGSGVGVFSMWLARRLDRPVHLVDHDPTLLRLAHRAFADVVVHDTLAQSPVAAVVTAMEVLEHVAYGDQMSFVRAVIDRVRPGGVLICSTPDERRYLGGWSGYGPHIGTLDPASLRTLLQNATGLPVHVWRIDGPGFRLGSARRVGEPLANRLWTVAQRRAPAVTERITGTVATRRRARSQVFAPPPSEEAFTVAPDADAGGTGTGLLAAVFKP